MEENNKNEQTSVKTGSPLGSVIGTLKLLGKLFLVLMAIAMVIESLKSPRQRETERCADTLSAYVAAQQLVEQRLKSPSTADFPLMQSSGTSVKYLGSCTHEIISYVDAQNSFGGMIRTRYYAKVQKEHGSDNWALINVRLFE